MVSCKIFTIFPAVSSGISQTWLMVTEFGKIFCQKPGPWRLPVWQIDGQTKLWYYTRVPPLLSFINLSTF